MEWFGLNIDIYIILHGLPTCVIYKQSKTISVTLLYPINMDPINHNVNQIIMLIRIFCNSIILCIEITQTCTFRIQYRSL